MTDPQLRQRPDQPSVLVPPSLLRIRQFLAESGLKVRPWESPEQTMEALREVLESNRSCPGFWHALEVLLGALTEDMQRTERLADRAVELSVFPERDRAALLAELKEALEEQALCAEAGALGSGAFRALAERLSGSAVVALCLVAGVALTGCAGRAEGGGGQNGSEDGAGGTDGTGGPTASGGATNTGGQPSTGGSTNTGGTSGGGTGGGDIIILPTGGAGGARDECTEDPGGPGGPAELDTSAIESILEGCSLSASTIGAAMDVVDTMNQCWRSGVRGVLEASTCDEVENHVGRMIECGQFGGIVGVDYAEGEFSLEEFLDYCAVAVYRGVAFE